MEPASGINLPFTHSSFLFPTTYLYLIKRLYLTLIMFLISM